MPQLVTIALGNLSDLDILQTNGYVAASGLEAANEYVAANGCYINIYIYIYIYIS